MREKIESTEKWEIADFLFVAILGTLLHFVYEWTDRNALAAMISPINESTWEHLKLLYMPALLFTVIQGIGGKDWIPGWITVKAKGVLWGMFFIVAFFFTYSGIWGGNIMWLDILTFYIGVAIYSIYSYRGIRQLYRDGEGKNIWGILIFSILFLLFVIFTMKQPNIGLFWE